MCRIRRYTVAIKRDIELVKKKKEIHQIREISLTSYHTKKLSHKRKTRKNERATSEKGSR